MADTYPYMQTVKNLDEIFARIRTAETPPKFTHEFLKSTLGFKSSGDRGVISVLRKLGFLSTDGTPTELYNRYRAEGDPSRALAEGLKRGWRGVFMADTSANELQAGQLQAIFKNLTGKSDSVTEKQATTFRALVRHADFSESQEADSPADEAPAEGDSNPDESPEGARHLGAVGSVSLRNDIHVHLPVSSDKAVFVAIFRALREELLQ